MAKIRELPICCNSELYSFSLFQDESTGTTVDYIKAVSGVNYTYTPELRGDDFVVDTDEIVPAYEEMWNGLVAMVEALEANKAQWNIRKMQWQ